MSKKSPQLRFEGFTDDWEERKLSDIADRFDNLRVPITASDRKSGDTPYYGANGIQDYVEGFTHDGEFILVAEDGANDLKNYPVQYVNGKVWVNNHAHVLQGKNTITDNKFLMNSIKNFNIEPFLVGGGRAKLNADVMMKLNILLPTFDEQEKIGSFFSLLDDTIALHQRKLDLLKEQKKGYLQKMFPKNGAKVPELRFAGFADDWEERKLKELFQPSKNKNNNGLYNQKDILAASLGTELIPKRTFFGLKSTRESVKNYRIVKTGDLIYTKSPIKGFPNGIIRSNKGNVGIVPPLYCVYTLQKDINSSIIQLYFEDKNRLDFYLFPLVNVGARNNVNITDLEFLEGKVTIPKSYEEQSKIVQFMEQLNTTIALHQRKLDLLKEQKKGFLQKMFV